MLIAPGWVVADREYWYPGYSQAHLSRERVDQGDYCISRFKRPSNAQDLLETYISMGEEQDSVAFSRAVEQKLERLPQSTLDSTARLSLCFYPRG